MPSVPNVVLLHVHAPARTGISIVPRTLFPDIRQAGGGGEWRGVEEGGGGARIKWKIGLSDEVSRLIVEARACPHACKQRTMWYKIHIKC
jgi:hypothetical protein